jgi:hypothetical protein
MQCRHFHKAAIEHRKTLEIEWPSKSGTSSKRSCLLKRRLKTWRLSSSVQSAVDSVHGSWRERRHATARTMPLILIRDGFSAVSREDPCAGEGENKPETKLDTPESIR